MSHTPEILPVDVVVGDDGDAPGIAQELTTDDIDDIAWSIDMAVAERMARLMELRDELTARAAGDAMGDMAALLDHLEDRMASLSNPLEADAGLAALGMDTDYRHDDDDPADLSEEQQSIDPLEADDV